MKNRLLSFTFTLLSLFTIGNVSAAEPAPTEETNASMSSEGNLESWYWTIGLGYSIPSYPSALQSSLTTLKNAGFSRVPVALDLGFYWPVADQKLILGPSLHGSTDSYTKDSLKLSLTQSGVYFSSMYTFGKEPSDGFILRGDIGVASISVSADTGTTSVSARSNSGLGLNAGAGYGFSVSEGTRLLLLGLYSYRSIESENYGDFTITVGAMF